MASYHKMMNFTTFILICSVFCKYTAQDKVGVSVFYESLCPDSIRFFTTQLYPGYEKLGDYLNIDLVPYGKANQTEVDGKWEFHCQHGPNECFGNKIQVCMIIHHPNTETQMNFIECMMSSTNPASFVIAKKCANKMKLLWSPIEKCIHGTEGDQILAYFGTRTHALGQLAYVPHLIINGADNNTLEMQALEHFSKTICELIDYEPIACRVPSLETNV